MSCGCGCDGEIQVINQTIGEEDYLWPTRLTELTGADITSDTVTMAVGSQSTPGAFVPVSTPHKLTFGTILAGDFRRANPGFAVDVADSTTLYWVEGELFIGVAGITGLTPGDDYYPYIKLADTPATVIRRGAKFSIA